MYDPKHIHAFDQGCDARLAGKPVRANTFYGHNDRQYKQEWYRGWKHVQNFWGVDANWPISPLPPILQTPQR